MKYSIDSHIYTHNGDGVRSSDSSSLTAGTGKQDAPLDMSQMTKRRETRCLHFIGITNRSNVITLDDSERRSKSIETVVRKKSQLF